LVDVTGDRRRCQRLIVLLLGSCDIEYTLQRCYQDQVVRDQDQTKTRQAETETETKTKTKTSRVETKTNT